MLFTDRPIKPKLRDCILTRGLGTDGRGFYCMVREKGQVAYGRGVTLKEAEKTARERALAMLNSVHSHLNAQ